MDAGAPPNLWDFLLREVGSAATDLAARSVKDRLGLPAANGFTGGEPDLAALVVAAAGELGGTTARRDAATVELTLRVQGRALGVVVEDCGPAVGLLLPTPIAFRPGDSPDGLDGYLLGRNGRRGSGGWARQRHGGHDHYFLHATLPRGGLNADALARAVAGLAVEAAGVLAELEGGPG